MASLVHFEHRSAVRDNRRTDTRRTSADEPLTAATHACARGVVRTVVWRCGPNVSCLTADAHYSALSRRRWHSVAVLTGKRSGTTIH